MMAHPMDPTMKDSSIQKLQRGSNPVGKIAIALLLLGGIGTFFYSTYTVIYP